MLAPVISSLDEIYCTYFRLPVQISNRPRLFLRRIEEDRFGLVDGMVYAKSLQTLGLLAVLSLYVPGGTSVPIAVSHAFQKHASLTFTFAFLQITDGRRGCHSFWRIHSRLIGWMASALL